MREAASYYRTTNMPAFLIKAAGVLVVVILIALVQVAATVYFGAPTAIETLTPMAGE